jgi:predicted acylesterase/phospholipase RssA/CRP-like cAMP-binding protein
MAVRLDTETVAAQIRENLLFGQLEDDARALLAAEAEPVFCAGGEFLMHHGDDADAMYLVTGGRLQAIAERDGVEQRIGEIGRGEVVGEMALITREPRTASVQAVRDTQLLRIPAEAFTRLVSEHPEALRRVSSMIVARYVRTFQAGTVSSPVRTIAVVALDDGTPEGFAARLVEALEALGDDVVKLDAATVASDLDLDGRPDEETLARFVDRQEATHDLLVYEASAADADWAVQCVRQADVVLLVADATRPSAPRPLEERIATVTGNRHTELVLLHPSHTRLPRGTSSWLAGRHVEGHHHVRADRTDDVARVARLSTGRGVALVLSGGGARGLAHLGVIRAFEECGVPIDAIGGSSMGSLIAAGTALGLGDRARVAEMRKAVVDGPRSVDFTFPAVALASGARVTRSLQTFFGDASVEDLWVDTFVVSCNLTLGELVVHRDGPIWRAIRASMAIPGIFPPLRDGGNLLVDGGVLDNLPVAVMQRLHPGTCVIAVDVSNKKDLVAGDLPVGGVVSGWRAIAERFNPLRPKAQAVTIAKILMRLTELSSAFGSEAELADLVVRPPVNRFGALDFAAIDELVALGYESARTSIREWLASADAPAALKDRLAHASG